jgi:hypothetical protein
VTGGVSAVVVVTPSAVVVVSSGGGVTGVEVEPWSDVVVDGSALPVQAATTSSNGRIR